MKSTLLAAATFALIILASSPSADDAEFTRRECNAVAEAAVRELFTGQPEHGVQPVVRRYTSHIRAAVERGDTTREGGQGAVFGFAAGYCAGYLAGKRGQ